MNNIIILIILLFFIFLIIINYNKVYKKEYNKESFNNDPNTIPKIIIQTWKDNDIPEKYHNDIKSLKQSNPDYQFIFFTDEDIDKFIKDNYPEYYETYNKLPVKIQKIDFFRYLAVYHYGGFYFDLDISGHQSLDNLLLFDCIFPIDNHIKNCDWPRFNKLCEKGVYILLGQYAFGAKPKNDFLKLLVDTIKQDIDKYVNEFNTLGFSNAYVYETTGPDFVTNIYAEYQDKHKINIIYHPENQKFGFYASHNCYGTWK
jgi:mannosyltransferase OCH1-like enzyme